MSPKQEDSTQALGPEEARDWAEKYLDVVEVMIVVIDLDQNVKLINKKGCQVLGYAQEEILGQNWFEHFLPENIRHGIRDLFAQLVTGQIELIEYYENPVLTKSGEERTIAWHNTLLHDEAGNIVGTLSSGEDVTDRRREQNELERREAELRAILEATVEGVITIDRNGIVRSFNPAAERLFGFSGQEVIGKSVGILMPEPDCSRHDDYVSNYLQTGDAKIIGIGREVLGQRKDGTTFPLHIAVSEVRLGNRVMFTGMVHDLTEFKKMQEEVIQARNLAAMGEMAASVAHEIKNPLAGISGAIQVLKDTLAADDSRRQVMEDILGQVQRLDQSVRQLLVLSKPWNPQKEDCDLREYVERFTAAAQEQEAFVGVRFIFDGEEPTIAPVDPMLLEQVLRNLLDNAVQAMPDGGEIRYSFGHDSDFATISVTDTGSGIPRHLQPRLFQPFLTTKTRGTGLGLAICKKIMQAHNGSISISSQPGEGTEVTLQFPRRG